jgi:selenocysteine-specific elongation factor
MPRDLILGTAGHIDHGKTALVKALTGIDCDRLPEEKKRGITIDIGFAHLDLGDYRLGIVDVPGHERFIKNMLAGATSIDLALLVISAGESIKPQTREHLEILRLLGLKRGVIALTKVDLVDDTTREVVEMEIRDLVKGTFLEDAPIVATSAFTGRGIDKLKTALSDECAKIELSQHAEWFRLPIDRSFVVQGHGTVVTGAVLSGQLRVGDEVEWLPSGERVRMRSLHNNALPVEAVRRGQRAAINLAGVPHEQVKRGQELATPGYLVPSRVLTVRLHTLAENRRPIKHRTPLRLHIGTAEVMASVSLLDCDEIAPGQWGMAQLFCDEPVTATWSQPFVVRDSSAEHTLGGGQVLQPVAIKVRRRHFEMLEHIEKLWANEPQVRAAAVAWFAGWHGFGTADLVRGAGIEPDSATRLMEELRAAGRLVEVTSTGKKLLIELGRLGELEQRILEALGRLHAAQPLLTTHDRQKLVGQLDYIGDDGILQGVIDRLTKEKKLVGDVKRIARADFKPKLSANQRKLKDKIVEAHRSASFQPPEPDSFAPQAAGNAAALKDIFEVAVAEGLLVHITGDIYLHADIEAAMRQRVAARLQEQPAGLTVAEIRDSLTTTRKFAVPLCEYLDRVGITRRDGDLRKPPIEVGSA